MKILLLILKIFGFLFLLGIVILILGQLMPQHMINPVSGAKPNDWNPDTFWYYPWGKSVTHKGVDIFAEKGNEVVAATGGITFAIPDFGRGGNAVFIVGPKFRVFYYAHLDTIDTKKFRIVKKGTRIGTVGNTGNAVNTPPHLHFAIYSFYPHIRKIDDSVQGWKKAFWMNPLDYLEQGTKGAKKHRSMSKTNSWYDKT